MRGVVLRVEGARFRVQGFICDSESVLLCNLSNPNYRLDSTKLEVNGDKRTTYSAGCLGLKK